MDQKEKEVNEHQKKTEAADFWTDNVSAQKVMQLISSRKEWIDGWNALQRTLSDAESLVELAEESNDESLAGEVDAELRSVEKGIDDLEFRNMLSGEDDGRNAILTIHAGAGGTEAQDWGEMLLRMYLRWCEGKGYKTALV
ncbi:MAG TPA: PCRF domain-containing protein, partial [Bacteroidota bacterium]|nr:PCRF domain-containing protein [Bacteroidota bacterium]